MAKTKNWLTQREFAKRCGVTEQAIYKAVQQGRVQRDARNNKIDPDSPVNQAYHSANNHQREFTGQEKPSNDGEDDVKSADLHSLSEDALKKRKLIAQIEARELQTDIERGKYLESDLVEKFFRELLAIDQKALLNVGKRTAPAILALTGSEESHQPAIVTEIDGEIWKVIEQKKRKIEDFLTSLQEDV